MVGDTETHTRWLPKLTSTQSNMPLDGRGIFKLFSYRIVGKTPIKISVKAEFKKVYFEKKLSCFKVTVVNRGWRITAGGGRGGGAQLNFSQKLVFQDGEKNTLEFLLSPAPKSGQTRNERGKHSCARVCRSYSSSPLIKSRKFCLLLFRPVKKMTRKH
jgi:hypothetical protein